MSWRTKTIRAFLDDAALNAVVLLLLLISALATWSGLADFIAGQDQAPVVVGLSARTFVGLIVIGLTVSMYVTLREVLCPRRWFNWGPALLLYGLLLFWSVGFGYGFWWSLLAGPAASDQDLRAAITTVETAAETVRADIAVAANLMETTAQLAEQKADQEARFGSTCGIPSNPGPGPLMRARLETRDALSALSTAVRIQWLEPLERDIDRFEGQLPLLALDKATDPAQRRAVFEASYSRIGRIARGIGADALAKGQGFAGLLRNRATRLSVPPGSNAVFYCHDPDLAADLTRVADQISKPVTIPVPEFQFSDGPDGVARAVETLWNYFTPGPSGLLSLGGVHPIPLNGRERIALMAAIGVDAAIFVFTIFQIGRGRQNSSPGTNGKPSVIEAKIIASEPPIAQDDQPPSHLDLPRLATFSDEGAQSDRDALFNLTSSAVAKDKLTTSDTSLEVKDRIAKYDHAIVAYRRAGSDEERQAAWDMAARRLRELKDRHVYAFGAVGDCPNPSDPAYEIAGRHPGEGDPGEVIEVVATGFRHRQDGLLRPARIIVTAKI